MISYIDRINDYILITVRLRRFVDRRLFIQILDEGLLAITQVPLHYCGHGPITEVRCGCGHGPITEVR